MSDIDNAKRIDHLEQRHEKLEEKVNTLAVAMGVMGQKLDTSIDKLSNIVVRLDVLVESMTRLEHFREGHNKKMSVILKIGIGVATVLIGALLTKLVFKH